MDDEIGYCMRRIVVENQRGTQTSWNRGYEVREQLIVQEYAVTGLWKCSGSALEDTPVH